MSKIAKKPLVIPKGVTVTLHERMVEVKGPKGSLSLEMHPSVVATQLTPETIRIRVGDTSDKKQRALWGLTWRLIQNMIIGTTQGYEKQLEVRGIGYKVSVAATTVKLSIGFSHDVNVPMPKGIEAIADKNILTLKSIDKELLGLTAARLRDLRPPEPYKGKGIRYVGEYVRQKAGKAAKAAGAK